MAIIKDNCNLMGNDNGEKKQIVLSPKYWFKSLDTTIFNPTNQKYPKFYFHLKVACGERKMALNHPIT